MTRRSKRKPTAGPKAAPPAIDPAPEGIPEVIPEPVDIMARTIWGEARGESVRGKEAVAAVIMNRVRRSKGRSEPYWWGGTITDVCQKPWQFSCWNANDPNRPKLLAVTRNDRTFQTCLRVALRAAAGVLPDPTKGAMHYHVKGIVPPWARKKVPVVEIGAHHFYNDVE